MEKSELFGRFLYKEFNFWVSLDTSCIWRNSRYNTPRLNLVKETIALATVLFTASTITKTLLFGKHVDWKVAGIMALTSLPFAYVGASLLSAMPTDILKRLLGIMILTYLCLTVFKILPSFKIGTKGLVFSSASYGFVSGLLGSGNLIKAIIFKEMNITKEAFVGTMAATSILANVAKLTAYTQTKLLSDELYYPMMGLVFAAIFAALVGKKLLKKVSFSQFEIGLKVVLAASAVGLLF